MSKKVYTERSRSGFTLIELLVTVSIIGILSIIGMVAYFSVLRQGRDSKRQSDLRTIQSALEQYYADQFNYPASVTVGSSLYAGGKTYLNTIPGDPTENPQYSYTASPTGCDNSITKCSSYCLYAKFENSSPGVGSCSPNGSYNFAVSPP